MGDHRGGIARRGLAVADLAFSIDGGRGSDSREIPRPAGENAGLRDDAVDEAGKGEWDYFAICGGAGRGAGLTCPSRDV
jgi:hypothetical protein